MGDGATITVAGEPVDLDALDPVLRQAFLSLSHEDREGIARHDPAAEQRLFVHLERIRGGVPNRASRRARRVTRRGLPR